MSGLNAITTLSISKPVPIICMIDLNRFTKCLLDGVIKYSVRAISAHWPSKAYAGTKFNNANAAEKDIMYLCLWS